MRRDDKASVILKRARADDERQGLQPQGVDEVRGEWKPGGLKQTRGSNENQKLQRRVVEPRREQMAKELPAQQIQQQEVNDIQPERIGYDMTMSGTIFFDGSIPLWGQVIGDASMGSESTMPDPIIPGSFDPKPFRSQVLEPMPCAIEELQLLGFFQSTVSYFSKFWA